MNSLKQMFQCTLIFLIWHSISVSRRGQEIVEGHDSLHHEETQHIKKIKQGEFL